MATIRGTTPTHTFTTDIDLSEAETIYITYKQGGMVVLEKEKDDLTISEDEISFKLTQEESLAFRSVGTIKIQIRAKFADGSVVASNVIVTTASEILKEGVI